jgi:hypothetical protein
VKPIELPLKQRWTLVAMGAWIAGTICMSVVAAENFYTIDRLLAATPHAAFSTAVTQLGQPLARDLLRYLSSELNRLYFQLWNAAQLAIGVVVLWLIGRDPQLIRARWAVVAMLASVVLMLVWLTPAIVSLGRSLDFVPRDPSPPGMQRFWMLHAAYTSLEMIKLFGGIVATVWITRAPRSG